MKQIKFYIALFIVTAITIVTSCNKDINTSEGLYPLQPANLDANAGTWLPIDGTVVSSYTKYSALVPTPADTSTAAYKTELATT